MKAERRAPIHPGALLRLALACALAGLPLLATAQALPALTTSPAAGGGTTYSLTIQTLMLMTLLSFIPALVLMTTCFTRIVIVFSLLRQAMGTQTAPPNQVLLGLALFLTFFVMAPVAERVYTEAYLPMSEGRIQFDEALERASVPVKGFMLAQVREPDLALFAGLAKLPPVEKAEDLTHLPIEPLKFGPVMKALGEAHPAEFAEVYRLLKAVDAIVEKSALFSEIGKAGQGNSAEAQIYAKARAMVAKDGDLTFEEAVEKVMDLEPELYEKSEAEREERLAKRRGR